MTAVPSLYDQARVDLAASVGAQIAAGNVAWNAGSYPAAVVAYQSAGLQGAVAIGPEIDAAGHPEATQTYTQQAWQLNATLGSINAATATQSDALLAQTLANKMQVLYTSAINAGVNAANAPASSGPGVGTIVLVLAGLGIAGGLTYAFLNRRDLAKTVKTQRMTTRSSQRPTLRNTRPSHAVTRRA